jgi:hypothetical protein
MSYDNFPKYSLYTSYPRMCVLSKLLFLSLISLFNGFNGLFCFSDINDVSGRPCILYNGPFLISKLLKSEFSIFEL